MGQRGTAWATIGPVSKDAASQGTPDPNAVATLEELANQLALLRLTVPRPRITDQPLTLRELAALTGLPRSTLGNAESGRTLPRVEVVYKIAEACGVREHERILWVQARNRVAQTTRPQRRAGRLRFVDPVAAAEQIADREHRSAARAAVDFLAARSVPVSRGNLDQALDALPAARCADYLTEMPPDVAAACLNMMTPSRGAACLDAMTPAASARLLRRTDTAMVVEHLQLIQENTLWRTLPLVPTAVVARWLTAMPRKDACDLAGRMPPAWIRSLIADEATPCSLAADLYFVVGHEQIRDLPETLRVSRLAGLVATMNADPAAGLLAGLPQPRIRRVLVTMAEEATAARILAHLPIRQAGALIATLPTHRAAMMLACLPPDPAAGLLIHTTATRQRRLLDAMPNDRRGPVEKTLPQIRGDRRIQTTSSLAAADLTTE
jgi:transcriptional regulator with XRE-family HTH domain